TVEEPPAQVDGEAAAVAPALAVFIASWASFGMVVRVLWNASLVRTLDEGRPLHGPRSAWAYGIEQFRMGAMIVLVPLALIWLWSESIAMGAVRLGVSMDSSAAQGAMAAAQLLGVAVAFVLTPPIMMRVWRTVSLGSGEMRERLRGLCARHRVRCRDIRVWRTNGEMLNGAVIGIVAPVRYILLTDALLESLPEEQVEAVAAHEIAHIRRRHLPWLLAALVAAVWFGSAIVLIPFEVLSAATGWDTRGTALSLVAESVSVAASLVCAAVAFGFVSRAFERQADAFAVQSLSGLDTEAEKHATISEGAATVMADALASVARFNAIPTQRFFWRHGSIGQRRRRLLALVGAPVARTPADRAARRIKAATLAALLLMACVEGTLAVLSMKG
ncbi:MAG: M48 family metallopeptidase, partial [Phycisphaerales bacterium]